MNSAPTPRNAITSLDQLWIGRRLWAVEEGGVVREIVIERGPIPDECFSLGEIPLSCLKDAFWLHYTDLSEGRSDYLSVRDFNIAGGGWNSNYLFPTFADAQHFLGKKTIASYDEIALNQFGGIQLHFHLPNGYKLSIINYPGCHSYPFAWEIALKKPSGRLAPVDVKVFQTDEETEAFINKAFAAAARDTSTRRLPPFPSF